jgi:serine/threonine protein kinase/tetratricopeptide (TPR) repeat protein
MVGQQLLHYRVKKRLGTGGQATAYLATDTKLARDVVLKMLDEVPASSDAARKRFLREARLAATLDHPSICTIHDIHEAGGHYFIVMQFVDGVTLKTMLARNRLSVETAVGIAVQVADGLAAAHRAGVVHRDVKTANVMISRSGRAVILDFGLAKALAGAKRDELDVTQTTGGGKPFGTPNYMSPEQVRGELNVDARSDVFSFGVVLYEMLTGAKPFAGATAVETMNAVLHTEPRPLGEAARGVPPELEAVVARCMKKEPADRYPSAVELVADLKRVASRMGLDEGAAVASLTTRVRGPVGLARRLMSSAVDLVQSASSALKSRTPEKAEAPAPTLAPDSSAPPAGISRTPSKLALTILPFKHIGPTSQYEHFGTGLADTLITELAVVGDLVVRPLRTVLKYADAEADPLAVGQEMGVDVVLDGSFQVAGETLRATLRLFDVRSGDDIWTERFDHPVADLFALQDQVARRVVEGLRIRITDFEKERLRAKPTGDLTAYEHYIRAKYLFERSYERRDFDDAVALFQRAAEADPNFAPAHSGLGRLYLMLWFIYRADEGWLDLAEAACRKAIEIDPRLAESYSALASVHLECGRKEEAYGELETALELAPNDLEAHIALGWLYRWSGLLDRAVRSYKTAIRIDPGYWRSHWGIAMTYVYQGRTDEAERQVAYYLTKVDPQQPVLRFVHGEVWFDEGRYDLAEQAGEALKQGAPEQPYGAVLLAKVYAAQGFAERADAEMATVTRLVGPRGDSCYWLAQIAALEGRVDAALDQLRCSVGFGNENLPWFERDPSLEILRRDARYVELMATVRARRAPYDARFVL